MKKKLVSPLLSLPVLPLVEEIDYDSLWKFLIESFGFQFLRRFLPDLYAEVDLSYPIEYLEQEFSTKFRPRKKGRKITDKLLKVRLLSGENRIVLTHVEVHATGESTFGKKMYLYNSLIYLRYDLDVTALAIFTTERFPINHNRYSRECFGTKLSLEFNSFIISNQDVRKLSKSDDLFDLAILACLYIIRTRNNLGKRLYYKKKLHRMAEEKSFSHIELEKILIFVEDILQLPEPLEVKFKKHLKFKTKKLETMEMSQNSKEMFAAMFEGMYGMTVEKMKKLAAAAEKKLAKAEQVELKAEQIIQMQANKDRLQADQARIQADQARIQAEQARMQAEQAQMQAEQERLQAEKIQARLILVLYEQNHLSVEKIAEDYEIDLAIVKVVVEKHLAAQNKTSENDKGE